MAGPALSTKNRTATLDVLERERFDLAIIGGGISGAGLAREASLRGLRVALLEADDFAAGTSSRSSKLIHGGLRYLAMGDVALVRTTALERKKIHRLAPHLAAPRWLVVPARSYAGFVKVRAAVTTYEKLGAVEPADRHKNWSGEELAREEPILDTRVYKHACVYREYLTDDARLVLGNLRSAVSLGAAALNHAPVVSITTEAGRAAGVEAECRFSGRRVHVRARCVVNAAGPWVEPVRALEDPGAPPLLHLSKGVHIVVPAERLPVSDMCLLNTLDRRSIFVIRRGEIVYVGTTDTTYRGGHDVWPEITREDVEYLLEPAARCFTVDPIRPEDVVGAWAGLRPLIAEPGKKPSEISRKDEVLIGPLGVVTLAGGKLTGYRPMAREALETAARVAGIDLADAPAEEPPLPGGDFDGDLGALESGLARDHGLTTRVAARLVRTYGTESRAVVSAGSAPLVPGGVVLASEVERAVEIDGAATLTDVVYRRIRTPLYAPDECAEGLEPIADRLAAHLGWDEARRNRELEDVRRRLDADLAFARETQDAA